MCKDGPGPSPGPARMSYLPGSTSLAWVYKPSARNADKAPTLNLAPARRVIKEIGPGPGSLGLVQGRARPGAHVILAWF